MNVLKAPQDKVFAVFQAVSGIVERRHTVPILANVLIRKMGHAVQLTTSDGEIQIRTTTELGGDAGEFATTVGARKLIDILKTVPGEQTVSLEGAQGRVVLKAGKSRFTLQTLPAQKQDGKRDCRTGFVQSAATGVLICAILNTACGGLAMRRLTVVFDI